MQVLLILMAVAAVSVTSGGAAQESCYNVVHSGCQFQDFDNILDACNARYGGLFEQGISNLANMYRNISFDYLMISSYFKNYKSNRPGFSKLFRKLSDAAWENSIDIIRYINNRGLSMDFNVLRPSYIRQVHGKTEIRMNEHVSLAVAVSLQKELMAAVFDIHQRDRSDADFQLYLETQLIVKLRDSIRQLSGHRNDLQNLLTMSRDSGEERRSGAALNVFLFDDHLNKLY